MYRELGLDEIVEEGDEVLNQTNDTEDFNETEEEDRYINDWTPYHGYAGKEVNTCKGTYTGRQRVFRREVMK